MESEGNTFAVPLNAKLQSDGVEWSRSTEPAPWSDVEPPKVAVQNKRWAAWANLNGSPPQPQQAKQSDGLRQSGRGATETRTMGMVGTSPIPTTPMTPYHTKLKPTLRGLQMYWPDSYVPL